MTIEQKYQRWLDEADASLQAELRAMAGNAAAMEDAFYRELAFGTGGLRGVIGAGTNRMNVHVVGKASQGLADYLGVERSALSAEIGRLRREGVLESQRSSFRLLSAQP